ncbi:hypothetical protein [Flaviaesturariibacter aridisoli]|uniref:GNAT family N-acetyltransferase n=1 Tax=Flaviaesturariibacter aridisoli TaxID=2545761 RepID=A0A4R4DVA4_9BACT|nr:hypothetical protein [Flaviaesturariibacter aridisoli]TCZ65111.1 hypothetical protein E0486_17810 [Flaviaesturariibacter aridisoli]
MSTDFLYREASAPDIAGMQVVRRAVKENALSDPARIRDSDYLHYLDARGRSWVAARRGNKQRYGAEIRAEPGRLVATQESLTMHD